MAETWVAGSSCRIVHVPWDSQYQKVVQFASTADRDAYFADLECNVNLEIKNQTYIRPNTPIVVDAPYSAVYGANYLIVNNPAQPVEGAKDEQLFYFITDTQYASPASTRLVLQLDVWQTRFMAGATLGQGFLERGHLPVRQSADAVRDGADLCETMRAYCLAPEGLDTGSEYVSKISNAVTLQNGTPRVAISSTADLTGDFGTVSNPKLRTAKGGSDVDGVPSGAAIYLIESSDLAAFLDYMADYPWVSQNITAMYFVPPIVLDPDGYDNRVTIGGSGIQAWKTFAGRRDDELYRYRVTYALDAMGKWQDVRDFIKLGTYPYSCIELNAVNGAPLMLKPQLFPTDDYTVANTGFLQIYDYKQAFYPRGYGAEELGTSAYTAQGVDDSITVTAYDGDWLDSALWIGDPATFSTTNNQASLALASTAHTRQYSYDAAGWQAARSTAANRASLEQANMGLATQAANMRITNDLLNQQQALGIASGGIGVVGSLLSGNIGGAAAGIAQTGLNYLGAQASQNAQNAQFANNQRLQSNVADMNYQLGQYMVQSNQQQAIASINASVQDTQLTPPSIVGQQGGGLFNLRNGLITVFERIKYLPEQVYENVKLYFQRYGYAFSQWVDVPQQLNVMSDFSYYKLLDLTLECATANETESEAIRGIFARGVTVYSDPAKLTGGRVSDNVPR